MTQHFVRQVVDSLTKSEYSTMYFSLQTIMKDKWMNMGYEDDEELVPFKEPTLDIGDTKRIDILVGMGYNRHEVEQSLQTHKFDDAYASYLLLGRRSTDVSGQSFFLDLCTAHFFCREQVYFFRELE